MKAKYFSKSYPGNSIPKLHYENVVNTELTFEICSAGGLKTLCMLNQCEHALR